MKPITRRRCLKQIGFVITANTLPLFAASATEPQPKPTSSELETLTKIAQEFLDRNKCPGLSIAISRHGEIVYSEGFGVADKKTSERVTPSHLFRICSVTKPITSVAIYTLIEQGKLKLDDLVFGSSGVLGKDFQKVEQPFVEEITIHHLLTHTCGGWPNFKDDPMFAFPRMNHHKLIAWALKNCPLENKPGTHFAYSNFGYCILGRVIEKISGKSYEKFVRANIFEKCGIQHMQLAGNTLHERARNEVVYYDQMGEDPYGMNVRRMDSHGGWIGAPAEVVKFAMHIGRPSTATNILSEKTIAVMTSPTTANPGYASGWSVNGVSNWWHTGNLPGAVSFLAHGASGLCWAVFANTRCSLDLDGLMWKMVKAVPAWKA